MEKIVTTLLDLLGLLAVAASAYFWAAPHMGNAALIVGGAVVLAGSAFASREPSKVPAGQRLASMWQMVTRRVKGARG